MLFQGPHGGAKRFVGKHHGLGNIGTLTGGRHCATQQTQSNATQQPRGVHASTCASRITASPHHNVCPFYLQNKVQYIHTHRLRATSAGWFLARNAPIPGVKDMARRPLHAAWNAPRPPSDPAVKSDSDMLPRDFPWRPGTRVIRQLLTCKPTSLSGPPARASTRRQGCGAPSYRLRRRHHHHSGRDSGAADPADPEVIDINPRICGVDNHGHCTFRTDRPRRAFLAKLPPCRP